MCVYLQIRERDEFVMYYRKLMNVLKNSFPLPPPRTVFTEITSIKNFLHKVLSSISVKDICTILSFGRKNCSLGSRYCQDCADQMAVASKIAG